MVTSRSVPQHTAQIFSPFAGQNRCGFLLLQIGQLTRAPVNKAERLAEEIKKRKSAGEGTCGFGNQALSAL
jgi:hypothetical protein